MLKIINQRGQVLELEENSAITVEKFNPLFNDPDKFFQDISYPGTAPLSVNNKPFLNNAHLIETSNEEYELPVQVELGGTELFNGLLSCTKHGEELEYTLKPNFGAVAAQIQSGRLTELHMNDANFNTGATPAEVEAFMLDTCRFPEKYPYCFFPVYNERASDSAEYGTDFTNVYKFVNYYDYQAQKFNIVPPDFVKNYDTFQSPYFKVMYIIREVLKQLGFSPAGSVFGDTELNKMYLYNQKSLEGNVNSTGPLERLKNINPSEYYLPNMTVNDFLAQIRERLHLAFDFDLSTGECYVESFSSILASTDITDLSKWLESVESIEVPTAKGYSVSLEPDAKDQFFFPEDSDDPMPFFQLVVGPVSPETKMKCGTLRQSLAANVDYYNLLFPVTSQPVYKLSALSRDSFDYNDVADPSTLNNWQLRLIRYRG